MKGEACERRDGLGGVIDVLDFDAGHLRVREHADNPVSQPFFALRGSFAIKRFANFFGPVPRGGLLYVAFELTVGGKREARGARFNRCLGRGGRRLYEGRSLGSVMSAYIPSSA